MMRRTLYLWMLTLASIAIAAAAKDKPAIPTDAEKPRVFITDSESWEIGGYGGGSGGAGGSMVKGGARPQTAEIVKTFGERCPQVTPNNKQDRADYVVVLDHEGGKGFLRHKNKVAVFNRASGDSVISKSTLSLGGSVQEACEAIAKDWSAHGTANRAADASPVIAQGRPVSAAVPDPPTLVASAAKLSIASNPSAADIEVDGSFVGSTPSEIEVLPGDHALKVSKSGFKPWERKIKSTVGNVNISAELEPQAK
jgi:hypothetical protein